MIGPGEIALGGVLGGWMALSAAAQFNRAWVRVVRSRDNLHLIANWRFFAPVPARKDYHLEYRTGTRAAARSRWQRIPVNVDRQLLTTIWNPHKRVRKAFNTYVRRLLRMRREHGAAVASRGVAYLHLLTIVQAHASVHSAYPVQFRIVTTQDYSSRPALRLVFTSD